MRDTQYRKILVIKHGSLGDIAFALKAMNSIRVHFKDSKITIVTESKYKNFMKKTNYFNDILIDNRIGIFNTAILLIKIIFKNYNLIIDLQNSKRTNFYWFFLRMLIKVKINGSRKNSHLRYNIPPQGNETPSQGLLNQIKLLNINNYVENLEWLKVSTDKIPDKKLILIIPCVSKSGLKKQWPKENFAELCSALEKKGFVICVVGQSADKNTTKIITLKCQNAIDLTGVSPPEIIFSVAKKSSLIITNDTGPGHIAALSKKNVLWLALNNKISKSNIANNDFNFPLLVNSLEILKVEDVLHFIKSKKLLDK